MSNTTHNPINQLREDAIFAEKVKRVLVVNKGVMALLTLLQEFKRLRSNKNNEDDYKQQYETEKQVNNGKKEDCEEQESPYLQSSDRHQEEENEIKDKVTDVEFITLLRRHGVELTHFEERYLCNAFKKCNDTKTRQCDIKKNIRKKVPHYICSKTFIRHLTNVNPRRKDVIERAWCCFVEQFEKMNNHTTNLSDECTNTPCAATATEVDKCAINSVDTCENEKAASILRAAHNAFVQTITPYLSCSKKEGSEHYENSSTSNDYSSGSTTVLDCDEFDAIWSGVSFCVTDDNVFEQLVQSTFDMNNTHLTSNANSLVVNKKGNIYCINTNAADNNCGQTYYVKNALNSSLGVSTRSYNYSHMLRKFPFIPLLPPLDRKQIMQTTVQRVYKPFTSEIDVKLSDPLYSRRGQVM